MASVLLYRPFTWVRPFGQPAFMPGEEHPWFSADFRGPQPLVFQVSAHPTKDADFQSLAVTLLIISYKRTGGPRIKQPSAFHVA
jgi:hypothetical protein